MEKRKYVARPGTEPRISDLRVRRPTDWATRPGPAPRVLQESLCYTIYVWVYFEFGWGFLTIFSLPKKNYNQSKGPKCANFLLVLSY